jgi:hydroxymethylbilane synthase
MNKTFRIVSRKSPLALWQAEFVKSQLQALQPQLDIIILPIQTEGDMNLSSSLAKIGGKGLFVKALEEYLLKNQADIAVHSLKDMPAELPEGLELAAILQREDPREAFVSCRYPSLQALPPRAVIGTSSLRRQSQLYALRSDLQIKNLRGNVDTRIQKLKQGDYDGILLAVAGLKRLGLENYIQEILPPDTLLPAVGQGALSIECRTHDLHTKEIIKPLHHLPTAYGVLAERAMNAKLGGGCQLPIAGLSVMIHHDMLKLQGLVGSPDGQKLLKATAEGKRKQAIEIGQQVAKLLLAAGAQNIIDRCMDH